MRSIFFAGRDLVDKDFFNRYYPRLCEFARTYVKDEILAEDLAQDAFVALLTSGDDLARQDEQTKKSFLYTSVRYGSLNTLRRNKTTERVKSENTPEEEHDPQFLERIIHAEVLGKLNEAIEKLPKGCSVIFKEGYLKGLTTSEIAEELSISVNTVKSQRNRGLKILKKVLSPELLLVLLYLAEKK